MDGVLILSLVKLTSYPYASVAAVDDELNRLIMPVQCLDLRSRIAVDDELKLEVGN